MLLRNDNLPGYAIGGLAGGESKDQFWRVVAHACKRLPRDKPRYLMGVGYPLDLVVCTALGVDMYDCVYPTRTARFGTAFVPEGLIKLKQSTFADDLRPIDATCTCTTCAQYTRASLHFLVKTESIGCQLVTVHNLAYMLRLVRTMRAAIVEGTYAAYVNDFLQLQFPDGSYPQWVRDALADAEVPVEAFGAGAAAAVAAAGGVGAVKGVGAAGGGGGAGSTEGAGGAEGAEGAAGVGGGAEEKEGDTVGKERAHAAPAETVPPAKRAKS
jgi:queuine tRNA-ribosyltransferase